jgi:hypothetical protein
MFGLNVTAVKAMTSMFDSRIVASGTSEGNTQSRMWEDNIKLNLQETSWVWFGLN